MSMDEYLTVMKETTENLDDAGVPLPDPMVVWYTLKNLPKDYDILKQMILGDKLPTYSELKMRLLSEEMVKKGYVNEKEGEALAVYQNPHHRFFGHRSTSQHQSSYQGERSNQQNSRFQSYSSNSGNSHLGGPTYQRHSNHGHSNNNFHLRGGYHNNRPQLKGPNNKSDLLELDIKAMRARLKEMELKIKDDRLL
jgi:hypothetical protein